MSSWDQIRELAQLSNPEALTQVTATLALRVGELGTTQQACSGSMPEGEWRGQAATTYGRRLDVCLRGLYREKVGLESGKVAIRNYQATLRHARGIAILTMTEYDRWTSYYNQWRAVLAGGASPAIVKHGLAECATAVSNIAQAEALGVQALNEVNAAAAELSAQLQGLAQKLKMPDPGGQDFADTLGYLGKLAGVLGLGAVGISAAEALLPRLLSRGAAGESREAAALREGATRAQAGETAAQGGTARQLETAGQGEAEGGVTEAAKKALEGRITNGMLALISVMTGFSIYNQVQNAANNTRLEAFQRRALDRRAESLVRQDDALRLRQEDAARTAANLARAHDDDARIAESLRQTKTANMLAANALQQANLQKELAAQQRTYVEHQRLLQLQQQEYAQQLAASTTASTVHNQSEDKHVRPLGTILSLNGTNYDAIVGGDYIPPKQALVNQIMSNPQVTNPPVDPVTGQHAPGQRAYTQPEVQGLVDRLYTNNDLPVQGTRPSAPLQELRPLPSPPQVDTRYLSPGINSEAWRVDPTSHTGFAQPSMPERSPELQPAADSAGQ